MPVRHFSTWRLVVSSTQGTIHVDTTLRLKSRSKSWGCFQCLCRFASNKAQQEIADQRIRHFVEICDRGLAERLVDNRGTEKHMFVLHHLFVRCLDGIDSMVTGHWTTEFCRPIFCVLARRSKDADIQQKLRGCVAPNARTVPDHAARRQRATGSERILVQQRAGSLRRCSGGRATICVRRQIRQQYRLSIGIAVPPALSLTDFKAGM